MTEISRLIISVENDGIKRAANDLDGFAASGDKADRATDKLKKNVDQSTIAMNKYAIAIGAAGVAALTAFVYKTAESDDKLAKLATRLNITTEALSEYRHVAELSGISFDTLAMGFQRMGRRVAEAAQGSGEAKDALIELGLSAKELNNLTLDQQFERITAAMNNVGNESDKTRLAMRLFDTEGVALLQTMKDGTGGLRAMRNEAKAMGLTLGGEDAKAAEELNDALTRLKATFVGAGNAIAHELTEPLTALINYARVAIVEFADLGNLLGSYGAIAGAVLTGEFSRISDIIKERQAYRAEVDATIDGIGKESEAVKKLKAATTGGPITIEIKPMVGKMASEGLTSLLEDMQTEEDVIRESYLRRASLIEEFNYNGELQDQEARLLHLQAYKEYQEQLTAYTEQEAQKRNRAETEEQRAKMAALQSGLGNTASIFSSLGTLVGTSSKKAFEMNKKLQRASIIASTAAGMMRAYSDLGPVGGAIAKTAIFLQGAAALAQVNRTTFDGGGSLGGGGGGGDVSSGPAPNAGLNLGGSQDTAAGDRMTTINVTVQGSIVGANLEEIISNGLRDASDKDMVHVLVNGQRANIVTTNG